MINQRLHNVYLTLASLICVIFVTSNLISKKFVTLALPWFDDLALSAGVLFYPITFLLSDLLVEFYGKERANLVIRLCVLCGFMVVILVYIADTLPATSWSRVSDSEFNNLFNVYDIAILASCVSFYAAQIIDISIFSSLKQYTKGKYLWLRNNVSSITSQLVDTIIIVSIMTAVGAIEQDQYLKVAVSSYSFKLVMAMLDTPFCYLGHYIVSRIISEKPTRS